MLQPGNYKHKKLHRPGLGGLAVRGIKVDFGLYGLKVLENGLLSNRELEAGRMAIKRGVKKKGGLWIRKFPDISITGKKSGVRMGKGKGPVIGWVCKVHAGEVIFEVGGISKKLAQNVLKVVGSKLSVKSKFVILKD